MMRVFSSFLVLAGFAGCIDSGPPSPPGIIGQPSDASVVEGGTAADAAAVEGGTTAGPDSGIVTQPNIAPAFTSQPTDQSVLKGEAGTFSVTATGTPTPDVRWQRSNDSGNSWQDIDGATGSSYVTSALTSADNGARFRAVASNSEGSTESHAATLTVQQGSPACPGELLSVDYSAAPMHGASGHGNLCIEHPEHAPKTQQIHLEDNRVPDLNSTVLITYDDATDKVAFLSVRWGGLNVNLAFRCSLNGDFAGPACSGISLSSAGGTVTFSNTVLLEFQSGDSITLNGSLTFPPG